MPIVNDQAVREIEEQIKKDGKEQTEAKSLSGSEKDYLEKMIDGSSLQSVVDALVDICNEKADHVRTNWQDEPLAKVWEKAGKMLDTCRAKLPKIPGF